VTLDSPVRRLTVVDTLGAAGPVDAVLRWQLGPDVQVELNGTDAELSWPFGREQRQGKIKLPTEFVWTWRRGAVDPIEGWYAPRFGCRVPATTLVGRGTSVSATRLVTELELP
jgi:hypothetical protein